MKSKVTTYKGWKIREVKDIYTDSMLFKVYTKDEWAYGEGFRVCEWEACTIQEAKDFIDSYDTVNPVTPDNFVKYSEDEGFRLIK